MRESEIRISKSELGTNDRSSNAQYERHMPSRRGSDWKRSPCCHFWRPLLWPSKMRPSNGTHWKGNTA